MRVLFCSAALAMAASSAHAGSVAGTVSDESGPLPDVDIVIYRQKDTTNVVTTDMTADDGRFQIRDLPNGHYMLKIEFLGLKTKKINFSLSPQRKDIKNMNIRMSEDAQELSAVVITGERTALQVDADKKTFLVNSGSVVEGMSVSDLLLDVPSVDVDMEGNVSLRNNENVEVYINGRPASVGDGSVSDILEQLPAGSVEKVEVITNPSSKYNAEGEAGIINIVLKEGAQRGMTATINAGLNLPTKGRPMGTFGGQGTLSTGKWALTASAGWQGRDNDGHTDRDRLNFSGKGTGVSATTDTTFTHSRAKMKRKMNTEFLRLGASYRIDQDNDISLNLNGSLAQRDMANHYLYNYGRVVGGGRNTNRNSTNDNYTDGGRQMLGAALDYNHKFRTEGRSLHLSSAFDALKNENDITYYIRDLDGDNANLTSMQWDNRDNKMSNVLLQADYSSPWGKNTTFESGLKAELKKNESNSALRTASVASSDPFNGASGQQEWDGNDFEMTQNVYSAYLTLSSKIGKRFKYNLGLRGECTDMDWKQKTSGDRSDSDPYFHLFPSAFLSYKISASDEVQVNYTRRLSRPRMNRVNPYVNITDSMNVTFGNPDLDPELTHAAELNYIRSAGGDLYTASAYMKYTDDVISRYSWVDGLVSNTTFGNLSHSTEEGLELIAKNHFGPLTLTTNANVYYYALRGGSLSINTVDKLSGQIARQRVQLDNSYSLNWTAKMSADIKLPLRLQAQLTANYASPKSLAQGRRSHTFLMNAGLKRSFCNNKLTASANVRDVFGSFKFKSHTHSFNFDQHNDSQRMSTCFFVNVSYKIGSTGKAGKQKEGKGEEVEDFDEMGGD